MTDEEQTAFISCGFLALRIILCGFFMDYILLTTLALDVPLYVDFLLGLTVLKHIYGFTFFVWILTSYLETPIL